MNKKFNTHISMFYILFNDLPNNGTKEFFKIKLRSESHSALKGNGFAAHILEIR